MVILGQSPNLVAHGRCHYYHVVDWWTTAANIITSIIVPSVICMIVPLIYLTFKLKGNVERPSGDVAIGPANSTSLFESG